MAGAAPDAALPLDRVAELTAYQNAAYAKQYSDFVAEVARRAPALEETVARYLYKLMAYKDEYEVARLLTKPEFEQQIRETWAEVESISYNLHPPLLRRFGVKKKMKLGAWFRDAAADAGVDERAARRGARYFRLQRASQGWSGR